MLGRALFSVVPMIFCLVAGSAARAAVELAYSYHRASPTSLNGISSTSSTEGNFNSIVGDGGKTKFSSFTDLYGAISGKLSSDLSFGLYYRNNFSQSVTLQGYGTDSSLAMTKKTSLSGWSTGIATKYFLSAAGERSYGSSSEMIFFLEAQIGVGKTNFTQTFSDNNTYVSSSNSSQLVASAPLIETNLYLGVQSALWESMSGAFKVGFERQRSTYYEVQSVSGGRYTKVSAGDRVSSQSGEDVRLERSGLSVSLALIFDF